MNVLILTSLTGAGGSGVRLLKMLEYGPRYGVNFLLVYDARALAHARRFYSEYFSKIKTLTRDRMVTANLWTDYHTRCEGFLYRRLASLVSLRLSRCAAKNVAEIVRRYGVDLISTYEMHHIVPVAIARSASELSNTPFTAVALLDPAGITLYPSSALHKRLDTQARIGYLKSALNGTVALSIYRYVSRCLEQSGIDTYTIEPGNGIDIEECENAPCLEERFDAAFISRLTQSKGILDLPYVWQMVVAAIPKARLAIVGKFENRNTYIGFRKLASELGITKNIRYYGWVGRSELLSIMKSSSVSLNLSSMGAFNLTVLEALGCNVPVVAYNIPPKFGAPGVYYAEYKDYGDVANHVLRLLDSKGSKNIERSETREIVRQWSWSRVAEAEVRAYRVALDCWTKAKHHVSIEKCG